MLLISGGEQDPNIAHLLEVARKRKISVTKVLFGPSTHPSIHWDIRANRLLLDGMRLEPDAAFLRYDVFNHMADAREQTAFRAHAWYAAIAGWIASRTDIRAFNRDGEPNVLKPAILRMALEAGMNVPRSLVSNDIQRINEEAGDDFGKWIGKPVCGGEYTQVLGDLIGKVAQRGGAAAAPAIIQERLVSPDIRVFRIGKEFLAFGIESKEIDYRVDSACRLWMIASPSKRLARQLKRLTDRIGLDFAAADYKTCGDTGKLKFLEVNTAPMFVAFDRAGKGAITDAMLRFLLHRKTSGS
ncbi:hypothetical protein EBAPG3_008425 [Nitrosospira lacus]|uniref:ATP-grasp domain-containing protein n=1 Tax=Nitrosospira lacus TaxID=1288494 RepID=A0A1W6SPR2_9PROT|nr:hypothetical protein [Nitrosospira lacus]ARO87790.1 hypothetical protein EBAPG3_008425 [Nitrosospira lacus]